MSMHVDMAMVAVELLSQQNALAVLTRQVDNLMYENPTWSHSEKHVQHMLSRLAFLQGLLENEYCRKKLMEEEAKGGELLLRIVDELCLPILSTAPSRRDLSELVHVASRLAATALVVLLPVCESEAWEQEAGCVIGLCVSALDLTEDACKLAMNPRVALNLLQHLLGAFAELPDLQQAVSQRIVERLELVGTRTLVELISNWEDEEEMTLALLHCFPNWAQMFPSHKESILKAFSQEATKTDTDLQRASHILCVLADHLFPQLLQPELTYYLLMSEGFWRIVQDGCCSQDSGMRKRAQFLLKKVVEYASSHDLTVGTNIDAGYQFWWNLEAAKALIQIWTEVLGLLQVFEEKQVHVIKPVLSRLDAVRDFSFTSSLGCSRGLHCSWYLLLLSRTFIHESGFIVRWGVTTFLSGDWSDPNFIPDDILDEFILGPLLRTLSQPWLYSEDKVGVTLDEFFKQMCAKRSGWASRFLPSFLCAIGEAPRDPLALYHMAHALTCAPPTPCLSPTSLKSLRDTLAASVQVRSGVLRAALYRLLVLELPSRFLDPSRVDLDALAVLLGCCPMSALEGYGRKSVAWDRLATQLQKMVTAEDAAGFVSIHFSRNLKLDVLAAVRMFLLLNHAKLVGTDTLTPLSQCLEPLLDCLDLSPDRLYSSPDGVRPALQLLSCLLQEFSLDSTESASRKEVHTLICRRMDSMVQLVQHFGHYNNSIENLNTVQALFCFLKAASDILPHQVEVCLVQLALERVPKLAEIEFNGTLDFYIGAEILAWLLTHLARQGQPFDRKVPGMKEVEDILEHLVEQGVLGGKGLREHGKGGEGSRLVSLILCCFWRCWEIHLSLPGVLVSRERARTLVEQALEALHVGGQDSLPHVIGSLQSLLPCLLPPSEETEEEAWLVVCENVLEACWKACFQLRKNRGFWTAISKFIPMAFHHQLMNRMQFQPLVSKYGLQLLTHGENVRGLSNLLVEHLATLVQDGCLEKTHFPLDLLLSGLVFGPLHRKDERLLDKTCDQIASEENEYSTTVVSMQGDHRADSMVRVKAVEMLLQLCSMDLQGQAVAEEMNMQLLHRMQEERDKRRRFYGDSATHRILHRILQALLLLQPVLSQEGCQNVLQALCQHVTEENSQPSIRYMQEWLLIRIMAQHSSLRDYLWLSFQKSAEEKVGSLVSFVSVAAHLACSLEEVEEGKAALEAFVERCLENILPWCMAQNFNVRVYSQVALRKLWNLCQERGLTQVLSKYSPVLLCLQTQSFPQGNTSKNVQKLLGDFYFSTFHPLKHFSLQTLFYELPRLARITREEWICPEMFSWVGKQDPGPHDLCRFNSSNDLQCCESAQWVVKATSGEEGTEEGDEDPVSTEEEGKAEENSMLASNFQKKPSPWKGVEELVGFSERISPNMARKGEGKISSSLVVVASLIEKAPNLGGLCRTCEAFSVSQLVLGSMRTVQDKQFQNLSVTAERWVKLQEVRAGELPRFLSDMRQRGYMLVGVEQTARSIPLHQFNFPPKTLLLLGNEKEGIPVELLTLLDQCVDIPQRGFIRSLNVHVAGALFVWEHARQNMTS